MKHHSLPHISKIAVCAVAGLLFSHGQATAVPTGGYEYLTRGPVHEAFAGTVTYDPEPGIVIDTVPPDPIEELPPEQQPEGENVVWIPGYWAWEEEEGTFLWVSGIWRNLPPGREWVPGYWDPLAEDQYQWISGYWADAELTHVSYLPAPPRSIESGPSVAAPSTSHVWLPGSWVHQRNTYVWRSGYWSAPRANWVYVPATYVWTPRGYIFVDGYWDYSIPRRGVVFAPVHYHRPVYAVAGYRHTPRLVISLSFFTNHLFLRPSYRHYYFGDYYAPVYRTRGYYACHYYHHSRRGYEPVYVHNRWQHRNDRHWERNFRNRYENLRRNDRARPPRTWTAMQSRPEYRDPARAPAATIGQYARNRAATDGQRFRNVDRSARERITAQTREVRNFGNERQRNEGRAGRSVQAPDRAMNVERSRSPIANRDRSAIAGADRARPDRRGADRGAPQTADTPRREEERASREAGRLGRAVERDGPRGGLADSTEREAQPERTRGPQRGQTAPERTRESQREQLTPQRAQSPQRQQATPQRAQQPQRQQATPQRAQQPQRQQATPQRAQQPQRQQATPQRAQRPQRQQATPQRAQQPQRQQATPRPQRQQATPQRAQQPQHQQAAPQRAQRPQRQQAAPQRQQASPQRARGPQSDQNRDDGRGNRRGR